VSVVLPIGPYLARNATTRKGSPRTKAADTRPYASSNGCGYQQEEGSASSVKLVPLSANDDIGHSK